MKKIYLFLFVILAYLFSACTKESTSTTNNLPDPDPIVYNFVNYTYIGYMIAHFENLENSITTTWDSTYIDSVKVKIDTAKDKIVFTVNESNPLGVYPQFEYDFEISSNYFRKNFVQNYYQSFYYEGDTLKSYFYRLQIGAGVSYMKEIKFSGYKLP